MQDYSTATEIATELKIHSYEIVSKTAEARVEVGDVVHMVVTAYDSNSGISDLSHDIVEAGIRKHLGRKPVRYRHVDPNTNQLALLGEVIDKNFNFPRITDPETGNVAMEAHIPVELYARTAEHVEFINFIIDLHKGKIAELDYEPQGFGFSLGWIENSQEFIPHEISATHKPKCKTCVSHPGTERVLSPDIIPGLIAEQDCKPCQQKNKGEQMTDDPIKIDPKDQMILDMRSDAIEVNKELTGFKSQIAEMNSDFDTKYQAQIAETDKMLAEKTAELSTATQKIAELEGKLSLNQTLPIRAKIAEMVGLEGEEAAKKAESLAGWSNEQLKIHYTDLSKAYENKEKDEGAPILDGADNFFNEFQVNTAEKTGNAAVNDEKLMKEFMGDRYEEIFPSKGGRN